MSMSYDDCQDIEKERERADAEDEVRQRLLGPISERPQQQARTSLHQLAQKCVAAKAQELLDNAELCEGYAQERSDHLVTEEVYIDESGWYVTRELMTELEDLLDDLKTIEKEGW
jgi:hypothetical protein